MASSVRQQFRAGRKAVLDAYKAANPTLLPHTFDYPPESYNTPLAYVEKGVNEGIRHDSGIRIRTLTGNVVVVNKLVSNAQATAEQDVLVDGLQDMFSSMPRATSNSTVTQATGVTDGIELTDANGTRYSAVAIPIECIEQVGR